MQKSNYPPKNMSILEASEFWDEHSLLEFDGNEEVHVTFDLSKKQYLGIDRELFKKLKSKAQSSNKTPEALLESWIHEKLL